MSSFFQHCLSTLGKKYIMALTGLLLGGFLLFHAAGNSLIFQGQMVFNTYAEYLRSLGPLLPAASLMMMMVFLLHIIIGITLALYNRKAKGGRYAVSNAAAGPRSWTARIMPYSGTVILAFLVLHLATVRFANQNLSMADRVSQVLTNPLLSVLYTIGIASLGLHVSHGFWSLTHSLGINHPRWNRLIRILAWLAVLLIISVFMTVILLNVLMSGINL